MRKSFIVNCGSMLLLRDKEDMLQKFDDIVFNCGKITIADTLYAQLVEKRATFNCGNTSVIAAPENPVHIPGRVVLDANSDYSGKYLVCDHLVALPGSAKVLEAMEGLLVTGTLFHPQSMPASAFSAAKTRRLAAYPDGAELLFEDVRLDAASAPRWKSGTIYFVSGDIYAFDPAELARLEAQNTSFQCGGLYAHAPAPMISSKELHLVPQGHALIAKAMPLLDLYATGGDKVYLADDITISLGEARHLERFSSLIVKGTATVPMDHLAKAKAVMQADKFSAFEGELVLVSSFQIMNHAFFADLMQTGCTLHVQGALILEDDVTLEDIRAVKSFKVNGAMLAPTALHGHLAAVGRVHGTLLGSVSELKAMLEKMPEEARKNLSGMLPAQALTLLGLEKAEHNSTVINCGSYTLI